MRRASETDFPPSPAPNLRAQKTSTSNIENTRMRPYFDKGALRYNC